MRLLHPLLVFLLVLLPVSVDLIECLNYRVPFGSPIPKAIRHPKCHSQAQYCVKINGNNEEGTQPFSAGRCENVHGNGQSECSEHDTHCFTRSDDAGKTEEVCCSTDNFSNHSSPTSVVSFIALSLVFSLLVIF